MLHNSLMKISEALCLRKPPPHTLYSHRLYHPTSHEPRINWAPRSYFSQQNPDYHSGPTKIDIPLGHRKKQNSTTDWQPLLINPRQEISPPVKLTTSWHIKALMLPPSPSTAKSTTHTSADYLTPTSTQHSHPQPLV